MTDNFLGLHVESAREARANIHDAAGAMNEVATQLVGAVQRLQREGLWQGRDADDFFESFSSFLPSVRGATGEMHDRAARLGRRIREQIETSSI